MLHAVAQWVFLSEWCLLRLGGLAADIVFQNKLVPFSLPQSIVALTLGEINPYYLPKIGRAHV